MGSTHSSVHEHWAKRKPCEPRWPEPHAQLFPMMFFAPACCRSRTHQCACYLQRKDMTTQHQFALHLLGDSTVIPNYLPQSEHPPETTTSRPGTNTAPEARTTLLQARQYMRVMPRARAHLSASRTWRTNSRLFPPPSETKSHTCDRKRMACLPCRPNDSIASGCLVADGQGVPAAATVRNVGAREHARQLGTTLGRTTLTQRGTTYRHSL